MTKRIAIGQHVVDWIAQKRGYSHGYGPAIGIGVQDDAGNILGGVIFHEYNGASFRMHVVSDGTKKWVTREWLHVIFSYAFDQAKAKRLIGMVPASNVDAIRFEKNVGFVEEARMQDAELDGDTIIMKMTKDMCRWINYDKFPKVAHG